MIFKDLEPSNRNPFMNIICLYNMLNYKLFKNINVLC
jgi:hypothetical protein